WANICRYLREEMIAHIVSKCMCISFHTDTNRQILENNTSFAKSIILGELNSVKNIHFKAKFCVCKVWAKILYRKVKFIVTSHLEEKHFIQQKRFRGITIIGRLVHIVN